MALNQITYSNKADINVNSNVPDTNKVKADDMNEIKTVVNAIVNQVNGLTGEILWTNSSPTTSFDSQNVNLSSSNYDLILWLAKTSENEAYLVSGFSIKGYGTRLINVALLNTRTRLINYVSDTVYFIDDAYKQDNTVANGAIIPYCAIGIKTGLF